MSRRRSWAALLLIAVLATTVLPVSTVGAQTPDTATEDEQTTETTAQPDPAPPADEAEGAGDDQDQPDAAEAESEAPAAPDQAEPDATAPEQAPPPSQEAPSTERAPPAEAEEPAVVPLSAGMPDTWVSAANTWYAYVGPGENLDVRFVKGVVVDPGNEVTIRVRGPGGVDRTCTVTAAHPVGRSCTFTDLTAATPGVWQIDYSEDPANGQDRYSWAIDVQSGTTSIDGRVYSERYQMLQTSTDTADFSLWYQSEQGFLYEATYTGYNGITSTFTSDATGVAERGTCVAAYESMDYLGPNSDTDRLWVPALAATGECGDPYKIFFEEPAASLPETAELWDGSTVWLRPPVALPELANLAFAPDGPTTRRGEFTFDVANFTGQLEVQVDVNNDGDYGDPVDRRLPAAVTEDGTVTVPFDGLDGQGNPIPATRDLNARVAITQAGEIHFVNQDVETRAGIEVQALNGPAAGSTTLYWDDTDLVAAGRVCTRPPVDGTAGVDSTGGVHGWICSPGAGNANDGVGGSWGDSRNIDDWTYHTIDESVEIAIPGEPQPPFECASDAWLFQYPNDTGPTAVRAVDMVTGEARDVHTIDGRAINAVAYNPVDDYIYGWDDVNDEFVRIGSDGSVEGLGLPTGWPASIPNLNTAEFDADGTMWVAQGGASTTDLLWARVDMDPDSPTYFQVLDSGSTPIPGNQDLADWAFSVTDGELYSVITAANGTDRLLVRFDTATETLVVEQDLGPFVAPNGVSAGPAFGAVYADADGFIYAQDNQNGQIWRVDPVTQEASFFAYGPRTQLNDGARCFLAPLPVDFGDAPDGYGTTLADDGARHAIPSYDAESNTAPLMLGEAIDIETDGQPTDAADGDDGADAADEDGVADPIVMVPGQPTTVSVTATNDTGQPATLAGWIDLNGNGTFEAGERVTVSVPANSGTASYELAFPAGTATAATYARFRLFPSAVADPQPTGPAAAGEVEDYPVALSAIEVAKTADPEPGSPVAPGDTVTYTVTITNTGTTDRTGEVVTDDLTGVLDDAELASGPDVDPADAGTAEIEDGTLTFTGDIPAGETVTVTYAVTVLDPADTEDGDATLVNGVVGGQCPDPPVTDPQDPAFDPKCVTIHPVRAYDVVKSSDPEDGATAAPGDTVTYTLTVTNTGAAAYTADDPATVSDDLSDVLDDATYNDDAAATAGDVSVDGETLTWSGPLPVEGTVTITYSVTVLDPTETDGDAVLENAVVGGQCPDPPITDPDDPDYDRDCHDIVSVRSVVYEKVISDPDVEELQPGDTFTYTVTATNTGGVPLSGLSFTDDLSGVIDDATYNDDATADIGTVSYSEPVIMWTGALDVGEVATITYSVTINDPVSGDTVLRNGVVSTDPSNCPPGSTDPRCNEEVPQPRVETVKSVVEPEDPQPGDTVTYQIVATNEGEGPALAYPITDDLTDVLDDAAYNDDAAVAPDTGTLAYTEPELSWVGDIPAGGTVTITYSVTVNPVDELGDGRLVNTVTSPDCPEPPVTDPDAPGFDPDCLTDTPIPAYTVEKSSDAGEAVAPGDVVTYTVTLTNTGDVDLEPTITDDLSGVLDDAAWNDDATASAGDPPTLDGTTLTWTGPLGVGETVTLTYSVTVNDRDELGDTVLDNVVVGDGPTNCPEPPVTDPDAPGYDPRCLTEVEVGAYTVQKVADTDDGVARPGDTVTYTVTVTNLGAVAYTEDDPASFTDDLSGVLDDATWNDDATASAGDPPTLDGTTLRWEGPLGIDEVVTVTYSVTVDSPVGGDHRLENVVTTPQQECEEGDERCRTDTPVPDLHAEKVADTTDTRPGSTVTYTITLTNSGEGDYTEDDPASFTDDLTDVLDDAVYNDDAAVDPDAGELTYREPVLSWSGPLVAGDSVTVTYTVTVGDPPGGDAVLDNRVTTPEGNCVEGSGDPDCPTSVTVVPPGGPTPPPRPTPPGRPASPTPPPARPSPITPRPVPVTG